MKIAVFWFNFHWNMLKGPIDNNRALVQIMAWRRSGDKPLFEPMINSLPTHICVTRPQWVNYHNSTENANDDIYRELCFQYIVWLWWFRVPVGPYIFRLLIPFAFCASPHLPTYLHVLYFFIWGCVSLRPIYCNITWGDRIFCTDKHISVKYRFTHDLNWQPFKWYIVDCA